MWGRYLFLLCSFATCLTQEHQTHHTGSLSETLLNTHTASPRDCAEVQKGGETKSGVYTIYPRDEGTRVHCDLVTDGGGWTVFQRRIDSDVEFDVGWDDYKRGFGDPEYGEYWLGNDFIHRISRRLKHELRVDLEDWDGNKRYAKYGYFLVEGGGAQYKLHISAYTGDAGDSLAYHNGMMFSTKDKDNDHAAYYSCAQRHRGAWWFDNCRHSNLNGIYINGGANPDLIGISWRLWKEYSFKRTEMKIRPINFGK